MQQPHIPDVSCSNSTPIEASDVAWIFSIAMAARRALAAVSVNSAIASNSFQLARTRLWKPSGIVGSAEASCSPLSSAHRNSLRRSSFRSALSI